MGCGFIITQYTSILIHYQCSEFVFLLVVLHANHSFPLLNVHYIIEFRFPSNCFTYNTSSKIKRLRV